MHRASIAIPAARARGRPNTLRRLIGVIQTCGTEYGTWVSTFLDRAFAN